MILDTPAQRLALLDRTRRIAVVGASANPLRASYFVFTYLRTHGYDVAPVNPEYADIDGVRCWPSLTAYVEANGVPDVIDVFRNPARLVPLVREAIALGAPAIWFQYGVVDKAAIDLADKAGMTVVVDRCMKVEHARFHGGLTTAGMNSGVVTSRYRGSN